MKLGMIAPGFQLSLAGGFFDFCEKPKENREREKLKSEAGSKTPESCITSCPSDKGHRVLFSTSFFAMGLGTMKKFCRGWIRTNDTQSQSLVTYHLSTRQQFFPRYFRTHLAPAVQYIRFLFHRKPAPVLGFRTTHFLGAAGIKIQERRFYNSARFHLK